MCLGRKKETFPQLSERFSPGARISGQGLSTPPSWELGDIDSLLRSDSWMRCWTVLLSKAETSFSLTFPPAQIPSVRWMPVAPFLPHPLIPLSLSMALLCSSRAWSASALPPERWGSAAVATSWEYPAQLHYFSPKTPPRHGSLHTSMGSSCLPCRSVCLNSRGPEAGL